MGIIPMYESLPELSNYTTITPKIIQYQTNEGILIITTPSTTKEFSLKKTLLQAISFEETTQITFASKKSSTDGQVIVDIGNNGLIVLNPQSTITLEEKETSININNIQ
jgi:Cft2 family RNA processing exonuclease